MPELQVSELDIRVKVLLSAADVEAKAAVEVPGGWSILMYDEAATDSELYSLFLCITPPANITDTLLCPSTLVAQGTVLAHGADPGEEITLSVARREYHGIPDSVKPMSWCLNEPELFARGLHLTLHITSRDTRPGAKDTLLRHFFAITNGEQLVDTKFLLFSRRRMVDGYRGASHPMPVYANSTLLQFQNDYFSCLLGNAGFQESSIVSLDEPPTQLLIEQYDYESDSDLDDEEIEVNEAKGTNEAKTTVETKGAEALKTQIESIQAPEDTTLHLASVVVSGRRGRLVVIRDTAYLTWKAMIVYLYTSEIVFAPFSGARKSATLRSTLMPPVCSARSMYRLADKLGILELRERALHHICAELSPDRVLAQLFSTFTSRYDEIRDAEMAFVLKHWETIKASPTAMRPITDSMQGKYPNSADTMVALLSKLRSTL